MFHCDRESRQASHSSIYSSLITHMDVNRVSNTVTNFMDSAKSPPLRNKKQQRFLSFDTEQDKALLQTLLSPQRLQKFHQVCNDNTFLFGRPHSKQRKQVQNRFQYLQNLRNNNFQRFTDLCHSQGIVVVDQVSDDGKALHRAPEAILSMSHPSLPAKPSVYYNKEDTDEFTLDLKRPSANHNGMLVLRSDNLVSGRDMIDCITIIKPLFDARDKLHVKAELLGDGTGFQVTEPSIPTYMVKDVEGMGILESEDEFENAVRAHHKVATTRTKDHLRRTKFFFPDNIRCKVGKVPGVSLKMKNQFRLIKVSGAGKVSTQAPQILAYIVWRLIVDGETRMIEKQESEDSDDYEQAYKRMSNMSTT